MFFLFRDANLYTIFINFSGLQAGEHLLKHTGIEVIKTAGGKLVQGILFIKYLICTFLLF